MCHGGFTASQGIEMCSQKAVRYVATREPMSDQMTRTITTIAISVHKAESNTRDSRQPTRLSAGSGWKEHDERLRSTTPINWLCLSILVDVAFAPVPHYPSVSHFPRSIDWHDGIHNGQLVIVLELHACREEYHSNQLPCQGQKGINEMPSQKVYII